MMPVNQPPIAKAGTLAAFAQILSLSPGLYEARHRGFHSPAAQESFAVLTPMPGGGRIALLDDADAELTSAVLRRADEAILMRATDNARLLLTIYAPDGAQERGIDIGLRQLSSGQAADGVGATAPMARMAGGVDLSRAQIIAHVQNSGDVAFGCDGWIGDPDSEMRIEGFQIQGAGGAVPPPLEAAVHHDLSTPLTWMPGGSYVGSRQRAVPIRRLAFRLSGSDTHHHSVVYQAAFSDGTHSALHRDGAVCLPIDRQSHLVAFRIAVQPRDRLVGAPRAIWSA